MHPTVSQFLSMSTSAIVSRYCNTHPGMDAARLSALLATQPTHFRWAGCDTFLVVDGEGRKSIQVVETNSCPSGQKSTPFMNPDELGGYRRLLSSTFSDLMEEASDCKGAYRHGTETAPLASPAGNRARILSTDTSPGDDARSVCSTCSAARSPAAEMPASAPRAAAGGVLAVIYDKNPTEATGYAAALADVAGESVYLAEWFLTDPDPSVRVAQEGGERWLEVRVAGEGGGVVWLPVRAAFRYVTQKPWSRIPSGLRTRVLNPVIACLAGGRNKMLAAKAYEAFNEAAAAAGKGGLLIRTPATVRDVSKADVPALVRARGGLACVKVPYGNAGQGVYTMTNEAELEAFMREDSFGSYDKFIVQELIGGPGWTGSGEASEAPHWHVGTVPDAKARVYAVDLRMMVHASSAHGGFRPLALYARRAHEPLSPTAPSGSSSWQQLGTNLSKPTGDLTWTTESERLLLADSKDFPRLGLGLDDLIDAFIQSVAATVAIDAMAATLLHPDGRLDRAAFAAVNDDPALLAEIAA